MAAKLSWLLMCILQCMHVDARWLKCRKRALQADHADRLTACFPQAENDMVWLGEKFAMSKYYAVCDRIAREYHAIWKKHGDLMHLNREDIILSVIPKVLRQIRPCVTSAEGYKDILEVVQSLIETTFDMSGPSSFLKVGSKQ